MRRPARLLPANLFPLRLPPPSPPALLQEEIQQLKSKLEKVEKERNELRLNSDRLESRITELTSELTDERNTGESASQLLDAETAERLRAEKEMKDLQAKYDALKKQMESMEMEVMEARLIRAAELNGELDDDDSAPKFANVIKQQGRFHLIMDLDIAGLTQKAEALEAELQDLSSQESKDEASLAKMKKQLRDLEAKVKDQEEELDEQAGTIQMLEQAKLRLEMEMERLRQTHAKEVESRDEEVEEIRQSCQKKLKQMEVQLEEEYEDKQKVLREKRELESKLSAVSEQANQRDFETEKRLRRDLKRTKALLADAQIMLDHLKNNAPSKREITQLKNQLEESEFTCAAAVKARKSMEVEIEDLHLQIDDLAKAKAALEEQLSRLQREKNEVQSRLEEDQEDMNELMKKHKAAVAQASRDLAQMNDLQAQLEEVSKEKQELQEKLQGLQSQLEFLEQSMVDKSLVSRQEAKIRELETRLEFERTQVKRLESLATRLKENMEKLTEERDQRAAAENREKEQNKRLQRQLRDVKEEMGELAKKEAEASRKKHELEMDLESLEAANQSLQSDLKLAFKRIGDLQAAIEDEMESDSNEDLINSDGDSDVDSELEERVDGVKSWLSKNKGSSKALSDDGSLKSSRSAPPDGPEAEERPVSVLSCLSYRKRPGLKDSIGGRGDEQTLFSALSERPPSPERAARRAARGGEPEDRAAVIARAFADASERARQGLGKRWSLSAADGEKASVASAPVSRASSTSWRLEDGDEGDERCSVLSFALSSPGSLRSRRGGPEGRPESRLSLARSRLEEADEGSRGQPPLGRSFSVPPRPRSAASEDGSPSDVRPVGHRSYLDPDLEAAIQEVLSYRPPRARGCSSPEADSGDDSRSVRSVRSTRSAAPLGAADRPSGSIRRSASALDFSRRSSRRRSSSGSSEEEEERKKKSAKKHSKKAKKKSKKKKKKQQSSSDSGSSSDSSSDSSSGSTSSYRSTSSVKKGPRAAGAEEPGRPGRGKKEEKQRKKQVDSLMMKYLYRPESD
ncbi:unconventional myosin-xviiia isoform x2 [Limosa lapponica baueri]|uniref:Unconventional myosin-xviiia isoform x2 n=1 Tax=Limosa lapponica baueri TaxID=1758121 RepID=A0A2I0TG66_LIMLA|nr:unconventional myosin-xviiia isoform x2 [Limosa lapponica baueri]